MNRIYLLTSILAMQVMQAEFLELPRSIAYKAVFHKRAQQLNDFSCGYNALYNACSLERACGYANRFSDFSLFKKTCMDFGRSNRVQAKAALSNKDLDLLAEQYFGMQQLCILTFNKNNKIIPLFSTPTHISYQRGISQQAINQLMDQAMERRGIEHLQSIKDRLTRSNRYELVHFVCGVKARGTGHWLLITLIKNGSGKGLYIFDNMNMKIDERSETKRYIDFFISFFSVSAVQQFKGPKLPDVWPSLPKQSGLIYYI